MILQKKIMNTISQSQIKHDTWQIIYMNLKCKIMNRIKLYLLELLLNNIFKYDESECRDKWMETTIDDIKFLIEE